MNRRLHATSPRQQRPRLSRSPAGAGIGYDGAPFVSPGAGKPAYFGTPGTAGTSAVFLPPPIPTNTPVSVLVPGKCYLQLDTHRQPRGGRPCFLRRPEPAASPLLSQLHRKKVRGTPCVHRWCYDAVCSQANALTATQYCGNGTGTATTGPSGKSLGLWGMPGKFPLSSIGSWNACWGTHGAAWDFP
jgi:hypothetical protein